MMNTRLWAAVPGLLVGAVLISSSAAPGQEETKKQPPEKKKEKGFDFKGGPGGFGPMGGGVRKIVAQFDKDGDGRLNKDERKAARESLKKGGGGMRFGPGGKGPGGKGP